MAINNGPVEKHKKNSRCLFEVASRDVVVAERRKWSEFS